MAEEADSVDLGLENKTVLIVGASKGIGRAIAKAFASEHCRIVAVARSEDLLKDLAQGCLNLGASSFAFEAHDIMMCDARKLAERFLETYGVFQVVIHNVGGSLISRNGLGPAEDWIYALKFNALAAIDMNSVLIPPMIAQGKGHIVHVSSISAKMLRGNPLYASAKAFLNAYVTSVGRQIAASGVTLCSVMPGAVAFPGSYWDRFVQEGNPRVEDFLRHHQAVNRFGAPEEIANAVLFLASDKASFMQAANIPVDGGNM